MVEELFVIKDGERFKLDLNTPSGISLNFKSNIFGDLSKITCSYSYTFKLPHTLNNRLVLDSAEDVRHNSNMVRQKLVAEYFQNGVRIFNDANMYIDTIENGYAAVLTWSVVRGMEVLKDDDISLRELPIAAASQIARFGIRTAIPRPTTWSNAADYYIPYRTSEGAYLYNQQKYIYGYEREYGSESLPVIPIKRLVDLINAHYGTQFYFWETVNGSSLWDSANHRFNSSGVPDLIAFGAVPLVKKDLTDSEYEKRTGTLRNVTVLNNTFWGTALPVWDDCKAYNVISYEYTAPIVNNYFDIGNNGSTTGTTRKYTFFRKPSAMVEKVELDGYIRVTMADVGRRWKGSELEYEKVDVEIKLIVYKRKWKLKEGSSTNGEIVYDEAATVTGKLLGPVVETNGEYMYEFYQYEFDFREEYGRSRISLEEFNDSSETYPYFMSINEEVRTVDEVSDFKIVPRGNMTDSITSGWEIDLMSNLPDISCLTFMKALYYMLGAFPAIDAQGRIVPFYYSDLFRNKSAYNVADWSDKLMSQDNEVPQKISFSVSGFGQRNYYLMKNDSLDEKDSDDKDDVYEAGMGCIICNNKTLDKEKTIIQIPFYGAFLQDKDRPKYETGRDMKYKKFNSDDTTDFNEAKPAIGIIRPIEQCKYLSTGNPPVCQGLGTYTMLFHVWDGFKYIDEDYSYDSLQTIMYEPVVLTEYVKLSEFDLRDLDYTRPVYLEKYNAYFAIVSIQRDANGKCKCEFIKLP